MHLESTLFLHHADVMDKLQGEREQLVVGAGSKQTIIHNLQRKGKAYQQTFFEQLRLHLSRVKESTWMLAGKHSAAKRDRKRCGRIFSLTLVLTGSCFSSCFKLPP